MKHYKSKIDKIFSNLKQMFDPIVICRNIDSLQIPIDKHKNIDNCHNRPNLAIIMIFISGRLQNYNYLKLKLNMVFV